MICDRGHFPLTHHGRDRLIQLLDSELENLDIVELDIDSNPKQYQLLVNRHTVSSVPRDTSDVYFSRTVDPETDITDWSKLKDYEEELINKIVSRYRLSNATGK